MAKKAARRRAKSRSTTKRAKVRIENLAVSDLADADYNARTATQEALRGLGNSLQDFGLIAHPVVNATDEGYVIVGGHKRVEILRDAGAETVDCIVVEFDEKRERLANLALNNPEIRGQFVPDLLRDVLARIREAIGDREQSDRFFGRLRFDQLQRNVLREFAQQADTKKQRKVTQGRTRDDEIPQVRRTKAVSKPGKVYRLGDHLLYCGKLSEPGTIEGLFGVRRADLTITRLAQSDPYTEEFLSVVLGHALQNTEGAMYVVSDFDSLGSVQRTFLSLGGHWSNLLLAHNPKSTGTADDLYKDVTVPVLYGWRDGSAHYFYGGRTESNVIQLDASPPRTDAPVEVLVRAIQNSTSPGQYVLDPWMAHGATLIAAEKTGRTLLGYVGTPRETDRIRERWTRYVHGSKADWRKKTEEVSA